PRLQSDHVGLLQLELRGVLDREDALVVRDERRDHVERRGLPGAGPSGDQNVDPAADACLEELRHGRRHGPELDQVVRLVRIRGEIPDRYRRYVDRSGRAHCVLTCTVWLTSGEGWRVLVIPTCGHSVAT